MENDEGESQAVDHHRVETGVDEAAEDAAEVGLEVVEHGVRRKLEGVGEGPDEEEEQGVDKTGTLLLDPVEDGGRIGTAGVVLLDHVFGAAGAGGEEGGVEGGVGQR